MGTIIIAFFFLIITAWAVAATVVALRYGKMLIKFEESIEEALDALDDSYKSIGAMAQRPLLFDSTEIRSMFMQINRARDAIVAAAQRIISTANKEEKEKEENDGKKKMNMLGDDDINI